MSTIDPVELLANALEQLEAALPRLDSDPLLRDGAIQRFEFTFELGWKALRKVLLDAHGIVANSPKAALREGLANGLLADEDGWLAMLEDRNLTSHTYREPLAIEVASRLPLHSSRLRELLEMLRSTR